MIDDSLTAHPPTVNVGIQINRIKNQSVAVRHSFLKDIELLALVLYYSNTANFRTPENKQMEGSCLFGVSRSVLVGVRGHLAVT